MLIFQLKGLYILGILQRPSPRYALAVFINWLFSFSCPDSFLPLLCPALFFENLTFADHFTQAPSPINYLLFGFGQLKALAEMLRDRGQEEREFRGILLAPSLFSTPHLSSS